MVLLYVSTVRYITAYSEYGVLVHTGSLRVRILVRSRTSLPVARRTIVLGIAKHKQRFYRQMVYLLVGQA
jgi:hypothetical protein